MTPTRSTYQDNGALAIILTCDNGEVYGVLTKNLPESSHLAVNEAYVDTNNCRWAHDLIIKNGLGQPTGKSIRSGWCVYPAYRFNFDKIPKAEVV